MHTRLATDVAFSPTNLPGTHSVAAKQASCPDKGWYMSAGHAWHAFDWTLSVNVPGGHK